MKKIWIIAPFTGVQRLDFRNRFQYIAQELYKQGYEIHLFTSDYMHLKWEYRDKKLEQAFDFYLHLIHETGYTSTISPKRAISHINFARNLKKKIKTMDKPDLIYCAYPTMTAAFFMGKFAEKNNIPFVLDIQDTWPESISAGINTDKLLVKLAMYPFTLYANMIYRMADLIIGVSETYANRGKVKGARAKEFISVYIGAEGNKFEEVEFKNLKENKDDIWITYIGTLSYSYDIETALEAFKLLEDNKNIKLQILGDGPDFSRLKEKAEKLGLLDKTIFFKGMVPYEKMVNFLNNSDIALNALKASSLGSITNKFGDYVSAGLPLLNCGSSKEVQKLVKDKELGINYISGNPESLKDAILEILKDEDKLKINSKNCKKFADEKFDRRKSYEIIFEKIKEMLGVEEIE